MHPGRRPPGPRPLPETAPARTAQRTDGPRWRRQRGATRARTPCPAPRAPPPPTAATCDEGSLQCGAARCSHAGRRRRASGGSPQAHAARDTRASAGSEPPRLTEGLWARSTAEGGSCQHFCTTILSGAVVPPSEIISQGRDLRRRGGAGGARTHDRGIMSGSRRCPSTSIVAGETGHGAPADLGERGRIPARGNQDGTTTKPAQSRCCGRHVCRLRRSAVRPRHHDFVMLPAPARPL
jgi:hypothetical protein